MVIIICQQQLVAMCACRIPPQTMANLASKHVQWQMSEGMRLALRLWCLTLTLKLLLYQQFTSLNLSKPF